MIDQLTLMVNQHGLTNVVNALGEIATRKGDHVYDHWKDQRLAKNWHKAHTILQTCYNRLLKLDGIL